MPPAGHAQGASLQYCAASAVNCSRVQVLNSAARASIELAVASITYYSMLPGLASCFTLHYPWKCSRRPSRQAQQPQAACSHTRAPALAVLSAAPPPACAARAPPRVHAVRRPPHSQAQPTAVPCPQHSPALAARVPHHRLRAPHARRRAARAPPRVHACTPHTASDCSLSCVAESLLHASEW